MDLWELFSCNFLAFQGATFKHFTSAIGTDLSENRGLFKVKTGGGKRGGEGNRGSKNMTFSKVKGGGGRGGEGEAAVSPRSTTDSDINGKSLGERHNNPADPSTCMLSL